MCLPRAINEPRWTHLPHDQIVKLNSTQTPPQLIHLSITLDLLGITLDFFGWSQGLIYTAIMTIEAACGTLSWTTTEYLPSPPWRVKLAGLAVLHVHSNENERSNNRSYESACLSLESVDFAFKLPLDGSPRTWTVFNSPESQNCSTWGLVARADDWQICPSGTLSTYWRSQSQHVKLRNYKCNQCGYGSSQKGDPRKQMKIHIDNSDNSKFPVDTAWETFRL